MGLEGVPRDKQFPIKWKEPFFEGISIFQNHIFQNRNILETVFSEAVFSKSVFLNLFDLKDFGHKLFDQNLTYDIIASSN